MTQPQGPAMIEAVGLAKYYATLLPLKTSRSAFPKTGRSLPRSQWAGKSTTMKLLTGYLAPSKGTARIAGHDMGSDRLAGSARLGYLPENGPSVS